MNKIIIKEGNIVTEKVDVIVNAANEALRGGGGVDGAIHEAAGPLVMNECRRIGRCLTGNAVITTAGKLKAQKIIHTVGPIWAGGHNDEEEKLKSCYEKSFILAKEYDFNTIAFPAISTGVYKFPLEKATTIAVSEALEFQNMFDEIRFVCFSEKAYSTYNSILTKLKK